MIDPGARKLYAVVHQMGRKHMQTWEETTNDSITQAPSPFLPKLRFLPKIFVTDSCQQTPLFFMHEMLGREISELN